MLRTPVEVANNAGRLVHLLERAAERQAGSNRRMIVLLGLAYHLARNGDGDRAAAIANVLHPPDVHDEWAAAAEWNLTALRQELHL